MIRTSSRLFLLLVCSLTSVFMAHAERPRVYVLTGARVIVAPGQIISSGTVVLRDGLIESVGSDIKVPADAYLIDAAGKTITAGFFDACTDIGQRRAETGGAQATGGGAGAASREAPAGAQHPLSRVRPERSVVDALSIDAGAFEKHRQMGFTSALTIPSEGIFRGEAALINLGSGAAAAMIVRPSVAQVVSLESGGFGQGYPSSLMGAIATVRQTFLDAGRQAVWSSRWEANPAGVQRPEYLSAWPALAAAAEGKTPVLFDVRDAAGLERVLAISREFSLSSMILASGDEGMRRGALDTLKQAQRPVILPLAYPEKPKVENADEALNVSLQDLERWDAAPENPAKLAQAGITFALGTCRLSSASEFPANLRKAIERGLPAEVALAALTTTPAKMLGVEKSLGSLERGRIANLVVWDGDTGSPDGVFQEKIKPVIVFVDGNRFDIEQKKSKGDPSAKVDPRGSWSISYTIMGRPVTRTWTITGSEGAWGGTTETQRGVVAFSSVKLVGNEMTVVIPGDGSRPSQELVVVITGETLEGSGEFAGQSGTVTYTIKGTRTSGPEQGVS